MLLLDAQRFNSGHISQVHTSNPKSTEQWQECATSRNLEDKPLIREGCSVVDTSMLHQGSGDLVAAGQEED